ncbi:hypothetical protein DPMN_129018 [Dreissena polymorpha]|uniref:Uncharacterized protein n=1 Tax=Dreissena polymorpha TaxID=45954 RepID=A0A9D4JXX2_DREPO|nr:hypothetical protein DPMN_129018 [Dreissena polymorpha]
MPDISIDKPGIIIEAKAFIESVDIKTQRVMVDGAVSESEPWRIRLHFNRQIYTIKDFKTLERETLKNGKGVGDDYPSTHVEIQYRTWAHMTRKPRFHIYTLKYQIV